MGIELESFTSAPVFNARCDGCDTHAEIKQRRAQTAQVVLRNLGWKRHDYINAAKHYTWLCPKCKVEKSIQCH